MSQGCSFIFWLASDRSALGYEPHSEPILECLWRFSGVEVVTGRNSCKRSIAMAKRSYPLSRVYGLPKPGPVLLLSAW